MSPLTTCQSGNARPAAAAARGRNGDDNLSGPGRMPVMRQVDAARKAPCRPGPDDWFAVIARPERVNVEVSALPGLRPGRGLPDRVSAGRQSAMAVRDCERSALPRAPLLVGVRIVDKTISECEGGPRLAVFTRAYKRSVSQARDGRGGADGAPSSSACLRGGPGRRQGGGLASERGVPCA